MEAILNGNGGGSKPYGTLSEQIENFTVTAGDRTAVLKWTLPPSKMFDPHFVRVDIVRKTGSAPAKYRDGTIVYSGSGTTYKDTGLTPGVTYYYRAFAINADGEAQTAERIVSTTAYTTMIWEKWNSYSVDVCEMKRYPNDCLDVSSYEYDSSRTITLYSSYRFEPEEGKFIFSGGKSYQFHSESAADFAPKNAAGKYLDGGWNAKVDGESVYIELVAVSKIPEVTVGHWRVSGACYYARKTGSTYVKGDRSYGTVSSTDPNAYPSNGRHTDGYWYIKK